MSWLLWPRSKLNLKWRTRLHADRRVRMDEYEIFVFLSNDNLKSIKILYDFFQFTILNLAKILSFSNTAKSCGMISIESNDPQLFAYLLFNSSLKKIIWFRRQFYSLTLCTSHSRHKSYVKLDFKLLTQSQKCLNS